MNAADIILGPTLAAGRGGSLALVCGERSISYAELLALANRFGNAFLAAGCRRGEPVLFLLDDGIELMAAYLGAMRAGLVAVALNTRSAPKDLAHAMADSGARLLLAEPELAQAARAAAPRSVAIVEAGVETGRLDDFLGDASDELEAADTAPEDPCLWIYTSGTTGQPKGAVHVHGSIALGLRHVAENLGVRPGDRLFSTSKLFFAYALGHCLIGGLCAGATIILHRGWPDANAAARVIGRERPDVVLSVPALYRLMLLDGLAESEAFARPRLYVSAGERLPEELCRRWTEATGRPVYEGIGATEAIFLFMANTPGFVRPGTVGRPLPWAEARLVGPEGGAIDTPDTPGDLWIRMDSLFRRYHNRPEIAERVLKDGWWRTGDVFTFDADGFWTPQGRSDDMIKVSGQWVSPAEIEEAALSAPGIAEAAAVGIPNEDGLIRLVLFAVAAEGERLPELEARVLGSMREKLAVYKCPRTIRFVETIPRTATGKVQRFKLRNGEESA